MILYTHIKMNIITTINIANLIEYFLQKIAYKNMIMNYHIIQETIQNMILNIMINLNHVLKMNIALNIITN